MMTLAYKGGWEVIQLLTFADRGGVGVKNGLKYADFIFAWSLILSYPLVNSGLQEPIQLYMFFTISKKQLKL